MSRAGFACLLLILPLWILAQTEDLIPELDPIQIERDAFDRIIGDALDGKVPFGFRSSYNIDAQSFNQNLRFDHKLIHARLNYRKDADEDLLNGSVRIKPKAAIVKNLVLGNYRLRFGKGLVLGTGQTESRGMDIREPGSPGYYIAQGAALDLGLKDIGAVVFGSVQNRKVSLRDSLISYLPKSRSDGMDTSREDIAGLALELNRKHLDLGLLVYYQAYDLDFANPDWQQRLFLASVYGRADYKRITLSGELASDQDKANAVLSAELIYPKFKQEISVKLLPRKQIPAYAYRQTILSTTNHANEFSYRMRYQAWPRLQLQLHCLSFQSMDRLSARRSMQRIDAQSVYKDSLNIVRFLVSVFDREIIALQDSSYISSRPQHLRFASNIQRQLSSKLDFKLFLRYHLEEKTDYRDNSWYWHARFDFAHKRLKLRWGLSNWQTSKHYSLEPEELWEAPLSEITKEGLLADAAVEYHFKALKIGASGALSLITGKPERFYLYVGSR